MMKAIISFVLIYFSVILSVFCHPAWGLEIDEEGSFFFADLGHNGRGSVWKYHKNGALELLLSDFHAHNVNLDKEGNLITAHGEGRHILLKVDSKGLRDTLFSTLDIQRFFGGNCARTPDGEVIYGLSDHDHLMKLNPHTGVQVAYGDYKLNWNQAIHVDNDGTVYITEIGDFAGAVIQINTDGTSRVLATNLISDVGGPRDKHNDVLLGMTTDESGNVYVTELAGKRVVRIDADGQVSTVYRASGGWFPTAIEIHDGQFYVLEFFDGRRHEGPRIGRIENGKMVEEIFNYDTYEMDRIIQPIQYGFSLVNSWILLLLVISAGMGLREYWRG